MKKLLIIAVFIVFSANLLSQTYWFPVSHHIITRDDGSGGQDASMIPFVMSELNRAFEPAGIQFYMSCVGIDTIRSTEKYDTSNMSGKLHTSKKKIKANYYL